MAGKTVLFRFSNAILETMSYTIRTPYTLQSLAMLYIYTAYNPLTPYSYNMFLQYHIIDLSVEFICYIATTPPPDVHRIP